MLHLVLPVLWLAAAATTSAAVGDPPSREQFSRFALTHDGEASRGQELFNSEQRLGCTRCHTVDGSAGRAAPDLFAIGDKFGRREIIDAILTPSASIAVGYSTTSLQTKGGDEYAGIVKQATPLEIGLMGADGQLVRLSIGDILERHTSDVSLMPEGLQDGLTMPEFTDLIDYLVGLKQRDQSDLTHQGMPSTIPLLPHPVQFHPIHGPDLKFAHPVWFDGIPGETNTYLVAEQETGKVWRLTQGPAPVKTLFLDTGVHGPGARGLLELAFHPRFLENRRYYVVRQIEEHGQFASIIFEYIADDDGTIDSGRPPRLILRVNGATNVDHAGAVLFGSDGYLYVAMGDTGPGEDPQGHGQDTQTLLGKILRIDVDHCAPDQSYSIPHDNPFVEREGFRPEIWAYGFREPWRCSFDRATGDLWVADVGQDRCEEVDIVRRGENYGWNVYEGFEPFSNRYRRDGEKYVLPVFAYRRKYGPCVTGGCVYRAKATSSFEGVYICGDFESRRVFGLVQEDRLLKAARQIGTAPERIASFRQDPTGEIYVVGYEGTLFRMDLSTSTFE